MSIVSLIIMLLIAASNPNTAATAITPQNAEKLLPKQLIAKHCAQLGRPASDCAPKDFIGTAVDLNANGLPEFSIENIKIETAVGHCTLYQDEKGQFALIQKDFACDITPKTTRAKNWLDISGVIFFTSCEPMKCDFTWNGTVYRQGACAPVGDDNCGH
jgi:hypothetical protein